MSRSIGDTYAHCLGVSEEPDLFHFFLSKEHKVIVIASDGVWEVLTNE